MTDYNPSCSSQSPYVCVNGSTQLTEFANIKSLFTNLTCIYEI